MKPLLLLIPGMFNTTAIWEPVAAQLRGHADIRIADLLTQHTLPAMAADAWALVADRSPGTPLVVCGFSMGGYVAIELLASHGSGIDGVALVDTSARIETPDSLVVREKTIGALERNFARTVEGIIPFSLHVAHHNGPLAEAMRTMMHGVGAPAAIRQTRAIMGRVDHRATLARLRIPALVVCGREDKVTPPALSEDLATLIRCARLEWLSDAGHQTPMEQPAALAALLLPLLQQARSGDRSVA